MSAELGTPLRLDFSCVVGPPMGLLHLLSLPISAISSGLDRINWTSGDTVYIGPLLILEEEEYSIVYAEFPRLVGVKIPCSCILEGDTTPAEDIMVGGHASLFVLYVW